jgi:hypothetical protein
LQGAHINVVSGNFIIAQPLGVDDGVDYCHSGRIRQAGGTTIERTLPKNGVYASLFNKINLTPVAEIGDLNGFEDNIVMAETSADARVTAAVQVFMQCLQKSGQRLPGGTA